MSQVAINTPFVPVRYLRRLASQNAQVLIDGNELSAVIAYNLLNGQTDIPQDSDFYVVSTGESIHVDAPCMIKLGNKSAYYDPSTFDIVTLINFINTVSAVKVKPL